jgi:hypothetical protein
MSGVIAASVRLLILVAVLLVAQSALAATYSGACLTCEERNQGGTIPADRCVLARDGGDGYTMCTESSLGLFQFCDLTGSPCYNVDVDGGGGGGTGSGGTGTGSCIVGPGEGCPAQCSSCITRPYLN